MSFGRYRPDATDDIPARQYCQKTKLYERVADQPAAGKVAILTGDQLVKITRQLVRLGADTAHQCVSKWQHLTQVDGWTVFNFVVSLRYRRQDDIPLFQA